MSESAASKRELLGLTSARLFFWNAVGLLRQGTFVDLWNTVREEVGPYWLRMYQEKLWDNPNEANPRRTAIQDLLGTSPHPFLAAYHAPIRSWQSDWNLTEPWLFIFAVLQMLGWELLPPTDPYGILVPFPMTDPSTEIPPADLDALVALRPAYVSSSSAQIVVTISEFESYSRSACLDDFSSQLTEWFKATKEGHEGNIFTSPLAVSWLARRVVPINRGGRGETLDNIVQCRDDNTSQCTSEKTIRKHTRPLADFLPVTIR